MLRSRAKCYPESQNKCSFHGGYARRRSINLKYETRFNVSDIQPGWLGNHIDSRHRANSFWRQKAARTGQGPGPGHQGVQESNRQRFRRDAGSAGRNLAIHASVCGCPACYALEGHPRRARALPRASSFAERSAIAAKAGLVNIVSGFNTPRLVWMGFSAFFLCPGERTSARWVAFQKESEPR